MAKIHIQESDDWIVVKVDGRKFPTLSGHSLSVRDTVALLRLLGHEATIEEGEFVEGDEDDFIPFLPNP